MNLRTIVCWTVYHPKRQVIVKGFRTKKDLKAHYPSGVPIGCVVVKLKGHYLGASHKRNDHTATRK